MTLVPRTLTAPAAALVLALAACQAGAIDGPGPTVPPAPAEVVTAAPATTLAPLPPQASPSLPELGREDARALVTGDVLVSPDGESAAASCTGGRVCVWGVATGGMLGGFPGRDTLAWSPDGGTLALTGTGMDVALVDASSGEVRRTLAGAHETPQVEDYSPRVVAAAFSPDGKTLVTAGDDGAVVSWDVATGQQRDRLARGEGSPSVRDVEYSPDGTRVAVAGDRGVIVWRPGSGVETVVVDIPAAATVSFTADGRRLAVAGQEGYHAGDDEAWVRVYETGAFRRVATVSTELYPAAAFAPDGTLAYVSSGDRAVYLWAVGAQAPRMVGGMTWWTDAPVWAQQGRVVLTASRYEGIGVWDAASGKRLRTLVPHAEAAAAPQAG